MRLSEQIEIGNFPIDPNCGHIAMTVVLPRIRELEAEVLAAELGLQTAIARLEELTAENVRLKSGC